jgi:hypothetical protein
MQTALTAFGNSDTDEATTDDTETVDTDAETDTTTRKPWTDPRVLEYLYCDREETFSLRGIANDVFDGRVNREKIRELIHDYELMGENRYNRVDRIMAEVEANDSGSDSAVPETDVDYEKYTLDGQAGADETDDTTHPVRTDGGQP